MRNHLLLAAALCATVSTIFAQSYPLDPLTADEMQKAVQILRDEKLVTTNTWYNIINLKEPPKKEVLSWQPGTPFRREAFVSFYDYAKPGMTEAVVDLRTGKTISVKTLPNVIGMGLGQDSVVAENIVRKNAAYVAALRRRGIDIDSVVHRTMPPSAIANSSSSPTSKAIRSTSKACSPTSTSPPGK